MTKDELTGVIVAAPEIVRIKDMTEAEKVTLCSRQIDLLSRHIIYSYGWDFALEVYDLALTVDENDYVIRGTSNHCAQIFNIRYGNTDGDDGDFEPITKKSATSIDDYMSRNKPGNCEIWTPIARVGGFPKIRILDTPSVTGKSLRIRYWRKGLQFEDLDADIFDNALEVGVRAKINPVLWSLFKSILAGVIDHYEPSSGDSDPVVIDKIVSMMNQRRANLMGY